MLGIVSDAWNNKTKENFKDAQVVERQRWLNVRYMLKAVH